MGFRLTPERFGRLPHLWLIYLVFLFIGPAYTESADDLWLAIGAAAVFLPIYFASFWLHGAAALVSIGLMVALGAAVARHNLGASVFWIFAAGSAGAVGSPRRAALVLVAEVCLLVPVVVFLQPLWVFGAVALIGIVAVGAIGIHMNEAERNRQRLELAHSEIEQLARIAERERIARDLHDLLGHTLSVIAVKSELAHRVFERDPERAASEIAEVESISREALAEVRTAVAGFRGSRGASIDKQLENARGVLQSAGVELSCEAGPDRLAPVLDAQREGVLALALREGITNVIRHAGATRCVVECFVRDDAYGMVISDDGRGSTARDGAGLVGMRERIAALGGSVDRTTRAGTRLELRFPREPTRSPGAGVAP